MGVEWLGVHTHGWVGRWGWEWLGVHTHMHAHMHGWVNGMGEVKSLKILKMLTESR